MTFALVIWLTGDVPMGAAFYSVSCGMTVLNERLEECRRNINAKARHHFAGKEAATSEKDYLLGHVGTLRYLRKKYVELCQAVETLSDACGVLLLATCFGGGLILVFNIFLILASAGEVIANKQYLTLVTLIAPVVVFMARLVAICFILSWPSEKASTSSKTCCFLEVFLRLGDSIVVLFLTGI